MTPDTQARGLGALVHRYQQQRTPAAAEGLLLYLAADLRRRARRWRPEPPAVRYEDIRQQFALEVLDAALRLSPHQEERWLRRRLLQRATARIAAWIAAERRQRSQPLPIDLPTPDDPEMALLLRFADRDPALQLLVRHHLDGVPVWLLAQQHRVGYQTMRKRLSRARSQLAKEFRKV